MTNEQTVDLHGGISAEDRTTMYIRAVSPMILALCETLGLDGPMSLRSLLGWVCFGSRGDLTRANRLLLVLVGLSRRLGRDLRLRGFFAAAFGRFSLRSFRVTFQLRGFNTLNAFRVDPANYDHTQFLHSVPSSQLSVEQMRGSMITAIVNDSDAGHCELVRPSLIHYLMAVDSAFTLPLSGRLLLVSHMFDAFVVPYDLELLSDSPSIYTICDVLDGLLSSIVSRLLVVLTFLSEESLPVTRANVRLCYQLFSSRDYFSGVYLLHRQTCVSSGSGRRTTGLCFPPRLNRVKIRRALVGLVSKVGGTSAADRPANQLRLMCIMNSGRGLLTTVFDVCVSSIQAHYALPDNMPSRIFGPNIARLVTFSFMSLGAEYDVRLSSIPNFPSLVEPPTRPRLTEAQLPQSSELPIIALPPIPSGTDQDGFDPSHRIFCELRKRFTYVRGAIFSSGIVQKSVDCPPKYRPSGTSFAVLRRLSHVLVRHLTFRNNIFLRDRLEQLRERCGLRLFCSAAESFDQLALNCVPTQLAYALGKDLQTSTNLSSAEGIIRRFVDLVCAAVPRTIKALKHIIGDYRRSLFHRTHQLTKKYGVECIPNRVYVSQIFWPTLHLRAIESSIKSIMAGGNSCTRGGVGRGCGGASVDSVQRGNSSFLSSNGSLSCVVCRAGPVCALASLSLGCVCFSGVIPFRVLVRECFLSGNDEGSVSWFDYAGAKLTSLCTDSHSSRDLSRFDVDRYHLGTLYSVRGCLMVWRKQYAARPLIFANEGSFQSWMCTNAGAHYLNGNIMPSRDVLSPDFIAACGIRRVVRVLSVRFGPDRESLLLFLEITLDDSVRITPRWTFIDEFQSRVSVSLGSRYNIGSCLQLPNSDPYRTLYSGTVLLELVGVDDFSNYVDSMTGLFQRVQMRRSAGNDLGTMSIFLTPSLMLPSLVRFLDSNILRHQHYVCSKGDRVSLFLLIVGPIPASVKMEALRLAHRDSYRVGWEVYRAGLASETVTRFLFRDRSYQWYIVEFVGRRDPLDF